MARSSPIHAMGGSRSMLVAFRVAAAALAGAAIYHLIAVVVPRFGHWAYSPAYPLWRHVIFIAIDTAFAVLLLRRPPWLVWAYSVLAAQQAFGRHGYAVWSTWVYEHRIDWYDLADVAGVLAIFVLLSGDERQRRREQRSREARRAGVGVERF